jgi:hypothetical protein
MLAENYAPGDRRSIGMDVEDRQEDANASRFGSQNVRLIDFNDVSNRSVRSGQDHVRVVRNAAFRITEKVQGVNDQDQDKQTRPDAEKQTNDCKKHQNREDPASFSEGL